MLTNFYFYSSKAFYTFLFCVLATCVYTQAEKNFEEKKDITIHFRPELKGHFLDINTSYFIPELKDSISISQLKFYISNITFYKNQRITSKTEELCSLINLEDENSLTKEFQLSSKEEYNFIEFYIGVDSLIQMQGAHGGNLDPSNGMYWSWQSGYINFKLEGTSKKCPSRNNAFQFHIGGFLAPFNTYRVVRLPVQKSDSMIITIDLNQILTIENIIQKYEIMSPSLNAMTFANLFPQLFIIKP